MSNQLQRELAQFAIQIKCQSIATRISTICNSNVNRLQCELAQFAIQMSIDCNNEHDFQFNEIEIKQLANNRDQNMQSQTIEIEI
jgi:hypothetical protein